MPNELLIPFESLAARGVQKDTKMKTGSSSSFFYNIYLQTYKLIDQICHENKKYSEKNKAKKLFAKKIEYIMSDEHIKWRNLENNKQKNG